MSKAACESVLQRVMSDESFRTSLKEHPESALSGYDLTSDERAAIASGSVARIQALGLDERITKSVVNVFPYDQGGHQG
jgi:hypothetical protein